jgi:hypothetical protein
VCVLDSVCHPSKSKCMVLDWAVLLELRSLTLNKLECFRQAVCYEYMSMESSDRASVLVWLVNRAEVMIDRDSWGC